jgi:hypothetical protein
VAPLVLAARRLIGRNSLARTANFGRIAVNMAHSL